MIYEVLTWDEPTRSYTPQACCPTVVVGWRGLLGAARALRDLGYAVYRGDPVVQVRRLGVGAGEVCSTGTIHDSGNAEAYPREVEHERVNMERTIVGTNGSWVAWFSGDFFRLDHEGHIDPAGWVVAARGRRGIALRVRSARYTQLHDGEVPFDWFVGVAERFVQAENYTPPPTLDLPPMPQPRKPGERRHKNEEGADLWLY